MERAFEVLRRHARNHNLKLTDVALAVVRGDLFATGTAPETPSAPEA
jgi:hypothetical protein